MATFKATVVDRMRDDKTFLVRIRVTHKRDPRYITTPHYVTMSQLDKHGNIKDNELILTLTQLMVKYKEKCDKLSMTINDFTCSQLVEYGLS